MRRTLGVCANSTAVHNILGFSYPMFNVIYVADESSQMLSHFFWGSCIRSAKAVHYTRTPSMVVDFLFLAFVAGFFFSRLVFFPLFCLRPALDATKLQEWTNGMISSLWHIPGGVTLPGFLCVLQVSEVLMMQCAIYRAYDNLAVLSQLIFAF